MVSTSLKPKSEVLQDTISLIGSRVTTETMREHGMHFHLPDICLTQFS